MIHKMNQINKNSKKGSHKKYMKSTNITENILKLKGKGSKSKMILIAGMEKIILSHIQIVAIVFFCSVWFWFSSGILKGHIK